MGHCVAAASVAPPTMSYSDKLKKSPKQKQGPLPSHKKCEVCTGEHPPTDCNYLISLQLEEREMIMIEKRLCFRCFQSGHKSVECQEQRPKCAHCGLPHQSLFHHDNPSQRILEIRANRQRDATKQRTQTRRVPGQGNLIPSFTAKAPVKPAEASNESSKDAGASKGNGEDEQTL